MPDNRRHERIDFLSTARLDYNESKHFCQIKNLSISGAMLIMKEPICPPIPIGNKCNVSLYHDYEGFFSEDFSARIVYCQVPSFGVEFLDMGLDVQDVLKTIVNKEKRFFHGAQTIINIANEIALSKGIQLSELRFDNGKLAPERTVHCLRFIAGEHKIMMHLDRDEIEQFHEQVGTHKKIHHSVNKLHGLMNQ